MAVNRIEEGKKLYDSGIQPTYNNDGTFSIPGKPYKFNDKECSCMDKKFNRPIDGCKHNNYIREWLKYNKDPRINEISNNETKFQKIIEKLKSSGEVYDCEELYSEFGSELVDDAISHNVILQNGRNFILLI